MIKEKSCLPTSQYLLKIKVPSEIKDFFNCLFEFERAIWLWVTWISQEVKHSKLTLKTTIRRAQNKGALEYLF